MKPYFKIGDRVRVRGFKRTAAIVEFYSDIKGGVRLSGAIGGFVSWNVKDLVKVKKVK